MSSGVAAGRVEDPAHAYQNDGDGHNSFRLYLREIGQIRLLTREEELRLAKEIKRGNAKARELMIKSNLRLVVKIAGDYENLGLPLLDLISEGNMGLMKAVDRFDPGKGAKFSTYGAWWIKQSIKHGLATQSKTIRLPTHVVEKLFRIRRASAQLYKTLGREATDEELGEELKLPPAKIGRLRAAAMRPISLEGPLNEGESDPIADVVKDENASTPYEDLEKKTIANMVRRLAARLNAREWKILRLRFGLDGDGGKTLDEVGQILGLTRERIRQLQESALKKLRNSIERLEAIRAAT